MSTLREEAIAQLIKARLNEDMGTFGQTIDVSVVDGDIFLIGCCDNDDQRLCAIRIAKGVYGVRTVIDKIQVRCCRLSV